MNRFARQIMLPQIGEEGQRRLTAASVLIVGLGGLGCPVALYLAGAGVGRIGLADADVVGESNLHRQLLYSYADIGRPKVRAAMDRLRGIAPDTEFILHPYGICEENARDIISGYDLVVDCCDNYATRFLLDDCCRELGKPWVFGSISGFDGMVSTFMPGSGAGYALLCPDRDELTARPAAAEGVIGPTPGVLGSIQAAEALKVLCGIAPALDGKLLAVNILDMEFNLLNL